MRALLNLRQDAEHVSAPLPALMMQAQTIAASIIHGQHGQRKSGAGERFWQFREYQDTDRPQDIDWRQSAKTDHIFIKQKEWQATQKTYLWCAGGVSMDFSSDKKVDGKQTCAQIITLALAILLGRGEEQIGVFGDVSAGRGEKALHKIGHYLIERPENENHLPDTQNFTLPKNAGLICVGDFLSPLEDIEEALVTLSARAGHCLMVQILDPAEINLSYDGRIRFTGLDNENTTLVNNVSSIRADYEQRMQNHIAALQELCQQYGLTYVLHQTDADMTQTLRSVAPLLDIQEVTS